MSVNYYHRNGDIVTSSSHYHFLSPEDAFKVGNMTKHYGSPNGLYRKLCGVACELWYQKRYKPIFVTLTTCDNVRPEKLTPCLSNYLDNLKRNYGLVSYLWVCELQKRGAAHYHLILDLPFVPISRLNAAWCKAISQVSRPSANAVRLSPGWGGVIQSQDRVVKYVCKYISKSVLKSRSKICDYSKHLVCDPLLISDLDVNMILNESGKHVTRYEYVTVFWTYNDKSLYHTLENNNCLKRSQVRENRQKARLGVSHRFTPIETS